MGRVIVARKKFYAVRRGHRTGIYKAWSGPRGAQVQIEGFPGAVYRGFATEEEAQAFLKPDRTRSQPSLFDDQARLTVYTDGGAIGNPGPGGYGAVIIDPRGEPRELSGGYRRTTNNRMELMACIAALEKLDDRLPIVLHSDSRYLVDAINKRWVYAWKKRGWKKADGNPAKNPDLWKRLLERLAALRVTFQWVKGHAGHRWNERCDQLAGAAMCQPDLPADTYFESLDKGE
jgi:ribonuclease HI